MSLDIKRERGGTVTVALDAHEVMVVRSALDQMSELFDSRGDVSEGANATGAASAQVLSSAHSLSQQSSRLKQELQKFLQDVRAA